MSDKSHITNIHELELLVPDYLNGHVDNDQRVAIENAMASNDAFKTLVDEERALQNTITEAKLPTNASPDFSAIAGKIDTRSGGLFTGFGGVAAAACALILAIGVTGWMTELPTVNEFETLSSSQIAPDVTTVRLIGADNISAEELESVIATYDAAILQQFPSLKVYDVTLEDPARMQFLIDSLSKDSRFISVNQVSETQP